jgi:hypothetical protein
MISAGGAQVIGPASGGKVTPINNLGTVALQVIGPNAYRSMITFANPGTVTVYVAPLLNAQGAAFTPSLAALGGTFPVFAGGLLTLTGECQTGWQAFAASGTNNPFTVSESNV